MAQDSSDDEVPFVLADVSDRLKARVRGTKRANDNVPLRIASYVAVLDALVVCLASFWRASCAYCVVMDELFALDQPAVAAALVAVAPVAKRKHRRTHGHGPGRVPEFMKIVWMDRQLKVSRRKLDQKTAEDPDDESTQVIVL